MGWIQYAIIGVVLIFILLIVLKATKKDFFHLFLSCFKIVQIAKAIKTYINENCKEKLDEIIYDIALIIIPKIHI